MIKIVLFFIFSCSIMNAQICDKIIDKYYHDHTISNEDLFILCSNWQEYEDVTTDVFKLETLSFRDTLETPYCYYIPPDYTPAQKNAMIVYLHGGVGRSDFIEEPLDYARSNPFGTYAREESLFLLFPLGRDDLAWWKPAGMENIKKQLIYMKENYNIDDNRIYLTGFSDGGSASFHFALTDPDLFASFYPMSGNAAVSNIVMGIPTYLPNLQNRHTRAINTDLDRLYPSDKMKKIMELALDANADLLYKAYNDIPHNFDYAERELPHTIAAMISNPRDPFSPKLYWETANLEYNHCDWIVVESIDTLATAKHWHEHYSTSIPDDRLTFGVIHQEDYDGEGVMIKKVYDATPASVMGLKPQDIIREMDGTKVSCIEELVKIRDRKQRGDEFQLGITRQETEEFITLDGMFPPIIYHKIFAETEVSGAVKAEYISNTFRIVTSRVSSLSILIHPNMVNMDIPVRVFINGEKAFDNLVEIDRSYLANCFKQNKDRSALWINKLHFDLD